VVLVQKEQADGSEGLLGVISKSSTGASVVTNAAGVDVYRFTCELFAYIPDLCERYVNGSFNEHNVQLVEGAAEHMASHLDKVRIRVCVCICVFFVLICPLCSVSVCLSVYMSVYLCASVCLHHTSH